jgi:hypothetical protein
MPARKIPDAVREYLRALGARGGKAAAGKGARVLAERMTAKERSDSARRAAVARWSSKKKRAT